MKNTLYSIILLLIIQQSGCGQMVVSTDSAGHTTTQLTVQTNNNSNRLGYGMVSTTYTYEGSPFVGNTVWHLGTITLDNQDIVPMILSYNLVAGILSTIDTVQQLTTSIRPTSFTIEGAKFISFKAHFLGIETNEYGNLLYDGKTKFLVKLNKRLVRADRLHPFGSYSTGAYIDNNEYYVQKWGKGVERVFLDNKSIFKKLSDKQLEIKNFIKNTNLSIRKEEDIIAILRFYDSLFEKQVTQF